MGIPSELPALSPKDPNVDHAPKRPRVLNTQEETLAVENALRYFKSDWHPILGPEFMKELRSEGHITMRRFRPEYAMYARPIEAYPAKSPQAAGIMLMIQNNLDPDIAQFPHELITYGGNGSVFQNWAQYLLTMSYLSQMNDQQTLVLYSGHPLGLFPSNSQSPRVVITNGIVIPNHSSQEDYAKFNALGVSQYGQMTAGSFMYIGPQGIVHGTTITLLNAARKYLSLSNEDNLSGILYVTSGLGGMSGAQAKAAVIAGAVAVIAETNPLAAQKRYEQGWLSELYQDLDVVLNRVKSAVTKEEAVSIGYIGNIVDLLVALDESDVIPDLGSDQTSLHNPLLGGYIPVGYTHSQALHLLQSDPKRFKSEVQSSLRNHVKAVNNLVKKGMNFWDYGNAFLLESSKAGAEIMDPEKPDRFRYPSYVEDIMGPICFDHGFGPFRWVCSSGSHEDLVRSDAIAASVLRKQLHNAEPDIQGQIRDNIQWIEEAEQHDLVVGSQARILYADAIGRQSIAEGFNEAIANGKITAPMILGRDHHDVSGTDSPYRETADIRDGSMYTADMAVQNFVGDAFRGATWVSLHNGGGVGWGEVMNGGFGMVIDGSESSLDRIRSMLSWDVNNGIARRSWGRNIGAIKSIKRSMDIDSDLIVTIPHLVDSDLLSSLNSESS
jgi:urocanate hydratase|tara:strand:+ start:4654 stop:6651 length:1998 start_codon:yes stop_codon:yes gene_type:complete